MFFAKKMSAADFKNIRVNAGLSRAEVAERLGVSFPTVSKWEADDNKEVKLSLSQFETFMRMVAEPEEQRIIDERMKAVAELWQMKVKKET